jgi:hypothetical protein
MLVAVALLTAGCIVRAPVVVKAPPPPPAVQAEVAPPQPGPAYVWLPGHWAWRRGAYVWAPGHWAIPEAPGYVWIPGRWVPRGGGYAWVEGHWRAR